MKKALINSVLLYCSIASLAILTAMFTPSISSTANFAVGSPITSTSLGLNHSSTEGVESAISPNRETSSINAVAAMAATLIVDTTSDEGDGSCADGDCSLRDALASASGGDMIQFTVTGTITLTLGELVIDRNLMIEGPGADRLTISGNNSSRVFKISSGVTAMISGLTISNGAAPIGGGILNDHGTLTITNSTIAGNSASTFQNAFGGGIYNAQGTITITNSTVSGNSASDIFGFGGGIYNTAGTLTINNSTVSGNSASSDVGSDCTGGGIYSFGGRLMLSN